MPNSNRPRSKSRGGGAGGGGRGRAGRAGGSRRGDGHQPDAARAGAGGGGRNHHALPPRPDHPRPHSPSRRSARRYPSPSPRASPPHADRDSSRMYRFGDNYRPSGRDPSPNGAHAGASRGNQPHRDDDRHAAFTFRPQVDAPQFPLHAPLAPRNSRQYGRGDQQRNRYNDRPRGNRRWPVATHDRPIIRALRGGGDRTPERLAGMGDAPDRFNVSDDIFENHSDSEMEQSPNDSPSGAPPQQKRAKLAAEPDSANAVPKWSNPDPYTALPPPDESRAKKRDVVELIRRAKVTNLASNLSQNAIADNADFVSLDFGSDKDDEDEYEPSVNDINERHDQDRRFVDSYRPNQPNQPLPQHPALSHAKRKSSVSYRSN